MSEDLCRMKIKKLRDLALQNNVNIRDSNKKLKDKCRLLIEIVKKRIEMKNQNDETDFGPVEFITTDDETDFGNFEIIKPKKVSFNPATREKIVQVQNKPGRKSKNTTRTKRILTEEQAQNFIPGRLRRKEKMERQMMEMSDVNVSVPKNKILKIEDLTDVEEKVVKDITYYIDLINAFQYGEIVKRQFSKKILKSINDFEIISSIIFDLIKNRMKYTYGNDYDESKLDDDEVGDYDFNRLLLKYVGDGYYKITESTSDAIDIFGLYLLQNYIKIMKMMGSPEIESITFLRDSSEKNNALILINDLIRKNNK